MEENGGAFYRVSWSNHFAVPVAQLDKASDYESEDWGFKSLQGYFLVLAVCSLYGYRCFYAAAGTPI